MPWQQRETMSLRKEFVHKIINKECSISVACRAFGISRTTAYKWLGRHLEEGSLGLKDRSRRPSRTPNKVDSKIEQAIILAKKEWPSWGAKKLRQTLLNQGHRGLPSLSSFKRILSRHKGIQSRDSKENKKIIRFEKEEPNELWQMDFKGYFVLGEGECHPLTILDDCSRFSICLKACATENEKVVREGLEQAFLEYGLPLAMTMDNGTPWKGYPGQRLSNLTVWLMRLGIKVSHSRPGHPQTQGKLERFHRTLKEEVLKYHNFQDLRVAQIHFNEWREVYNNVRPHEGLGMVSPIQKYQRSARSYPSKLPEIEYLEGDEIREVGRNGEISFKGKRIYLGGHLRGEPVAVRERIKDKWDIYYFRTRLGGLNLR